MRKPHTFLVFALGACVALSAVGIATAENPISIGPSKLELSFDGGVAPKALPKKAFAPVVLNVSGEIKNNDGTQPSPLTEFILDADKNLAVDVHGYPTCSGGQLQDRGPTMPEVVCRTSILGRGSMIVSVAFAEQAPIAAVAPAIVLNGGTSGGKTTLFVHAYLTQPITTAIVTTVKISKIKNGRFGTKAVATVPPIANGAGSVTSFNLTINKNLKLDGKKFSMLDAQCPDGRLKAHVLAIFKDGTKAEAEITRPCTGKG